MMSRNNSVKDRPIKIIGLSGSPHPNGNTAKLIKKVLEGAESVGAETKFISLGNRKISFCVACYDCVKHGHCVIKDDFNEIRAIMLECDGIVIGSPTYEREITGQMKTFFDRMWFDIHRESFLGKYAVCVNTHNLMAGHSVRTLKELTLALGYSIVGCVVSSSLAKFDGKVERDLVLGKKAFRMGIKLVEAIKYKKKYFYQEMIRKFFIRPILRKIGEFLYINDETKL